MTPHLLLVAQASVGLAAPDAAVDLHAAIAPLCAKVPDEITVCARPGDETYRLRPLDADRFEPKPLRATTDFLGGTAGVETKQTEFSNGSVSKQVMVKLRFKF